MKQTSIIANFKAEKQFKQSHCKRILEALNEPLTVPELSIKIGIDNVGISRRMSELESKGKIVVVGENNGYSIYQKMQVCLLTDIFIKEANERKVKSILKSLLNNQDAFNVVLNVFLESITDELDLPEAFKRNLKNKTT